ncbi:MAG: HEAT repeat domain-containing protein, partial [Candidatus Omnitrophota bacterium]|nr:HEAT repeat domain-containing protein [Candidatus Omnitrophota bacterium]
LSDEERSVREAAAEALGKLGDKRAIGPLLKMLSDSFSRITVRTLEELGVPGTRMVDAYNECIAALSSNDPADRSIAAGILGELGDKLAVEPLLEKLSDPDPNVRQAVVRALGKLGDKLAVEPLLEKLSDPDPAVRRAAAESLKKSGAAKTQMVDGYIKALSSLDETVCMEAAETLGRLGDKGAVEPLLKKLSDPDPGVRKAVAIALGELGDKRAIEPLLSMLSDPDPGVRRAVTVALRKLRATRAQMVDGYIKALSSSNKIACMEAAEALGRLGDERAFGPLLERLLDWHKGFSRTVATALGKLGDKRAVEPLLWRLSDSDPGLREAVAEALGKLGDKRAVEPLLRTLSDTDPGVRKAAARALEKINDPASVWSHVEHWIDHYITEASGTAMVGRGGSERIAGIARVFGPLLRVRMSTQNGERVADSVSEINDILKQVITVNFYSEKRHMEEKERGMGVDERVIISEGTTKPVDGSAGFAVICDFKELKRLIREELGKQRRDKGNGPPHAFKAVSGYMASLLTGGIFIASAIGGAVQYLAQGDLTGITAATVLVGSYFAWAAARYFLVGRAVRKALKSYYTQNPNLENYPETNGMPAPKQLRRIEIAESGGYKHPAFEDLSFKDQRLIAFHESFESHFWGMAAMAPLLYSLSAGVDKFAAAVKRIPRSYFANAFGGFSGSVVGGVVLWLVFDYLIYYRDISWGDDLELFVMAAVPILGSSAGAFVLGSVLGVKSVRAVLRCCRPFERFARKYKAADNEAKSGRHYKASLYPKAYDKAVSGNPSDIRALVSSLYGNTSLRTRLADALEPMDEENFLLNYYLAVYLVERLEQKPEAEVLSQLKKRDYKRLGSVLSALMRETGLNIERITTVLDQAIKVEYYPSYVRGEERALQSYYVTRPSRLVISCDFKWLEQIEQIIKEEVEKQDQDESDGSPQQENKSAVDPEYRDPVFEKFNIIPSFTVNTTKKRPKEEITHPLNVEVPHIYPGVVDELEENGLMALNKTLHLMCVRPKNDSPKDMLNLCDPAAKGLIKSPIIYEMLDRLGHTGPLSLHLGLGIEKFRLTAKGIEASGELSEKEVFKRIVENIQLLKQKMEETGHKNPILLENVDHFPGNKYVWRPDFIKRVLEETGCGLLIDLGHVGATALTEKKGEPGGDAQEPIDYLENILDEKTIKLLGEVHIAIPVYMEEKNEWTHGGIGGAPDISFYKDNEGTRIVKDLLAYIIGLRQRTNTTTELIVNFETPDEYASQDVRALAETLRGFEAAEPKELMEQARRNIWLADSDTSRRQIPPAQHRDVPLARFTAHANWASKDIYTVPEQRFNARANLVDLWMEAASRALDTDDIVICLVGSSCRFSMFGHQYPKYWKYVRDVDMDIFVPDDIFVSDKKTREDMAREVKTRVKAAFMEICRQKNLNFKDLQTPDRELFGENGIFDFYVKTFNAWTEENDAYFDTYRYDHNYYGTEKGLQRLNSAVADIDPDKLYERYVIRYKSDLEKVHGKEIKDVKRLLSMALIIGERDLAGKCAEKYAELEEGAVSGDELRNEISKLKQKFPQDEQDIRTAILQTMGEAQRRASLRNKDILPEQFLPMQEEQIPEAPAVTPRDDQVTQLFEIVEAAINNRRTRLVNAGNELVIFLIEKGAISSNTPAMNRGDSTAEIRSQMEQALDAVDELRGPADEERIDRIDLPDNVISAAADIRENIDTLGTDSVIAALITLARSAGREDQKLIIGLETDWIPEYERGGMQHGAINPLIGEIESLGDTLKSMGLDNVRVVHSGSNDLAEELLKEAEETSTKLSNVVVLASNNTINSERFDGLRSTRQKKRAFLAGIDTRELDKAKTTDSQINVIQIIGMISIALELAMGKEAPDLPLIAEYDKALRIVIFLPKAEPLEYEQLKRLYKMRMLALQAA